MSSFVTPLAFVLPSDKPAWLSGKWIFPYTSCDQHLLLLHFIKACWPLAVLTSLKSSFSLSVYYGRTPSFFRSFFKSMFSENPLDHAFLAPVCVCVRASHCYVWFFVTLWTVAPPAPRLLCPWDRPGKNTGMACHFLLQGIFPKQGSNLCLLCLLLWQVDSLPLSHPGSPPFQRYVLLSVFSINVQL